MGLAMLNGATLSAWFAAADADHDGAVGAHEAVAFFAKSGLPSSTLALVWQLAGAKPGRNSLGKSEFGTALALISLAQRGGDLSNPAKGEAAVRGATLPGALATIAAPAMAGLDPVHPTTALRPPSPAPSRVPTPTAPPPSYAAAMAPTRLVVGVASSVAPLAPMDPPPCLELRPSPARSKAAPVFKCLAAGGGGVVAGPDVTGGMWAWSPPVASPTATAAPTPPNTSPGLAPEESPALYDELLSPDGLPGRVTVLCCDESHGGLIWSGHANGAARLWGPPPVSSGAGGATGPSWFLLAAWQPHRTAVTAIAATPRGDVITGSSAGSVRLWAARTEPPQSGRGGKAGPGEPAAPVGGKELQRTYVRDGLTLESGRAPHTEVRFLSASAAGTHAWSAGQYGVAVWESRDGAYVRDIGPGEEDPGGSGGTSGSGVTEPGGATSALGVAGALLGRFGMGVFGKVMSAADAYIGPGAARSLGGEGRIAALSGAADGTMWVGYEGGRLEWYTPDGIKLGEATNLGAAPRSLAPVGARVWAGLADGRIRVYGPTATAGSGAAAYDAVGEWASPGDGAILALAPCGARVYSLGAGGAIRGWPAASPCPTDAALLSATTAAAPQYLSRKTVRVLAGSYNVAEARPSPAALRSAYGRPAVESRADLVVVGFQEVEMGSASVMMAAGRELAGYGEGAVSTAATAWASTLERVLDEETKRAEGGGGGGDLGPRGGEPSAWVQVGLRQLSGIVIVALTRRRLAPHVGDVRTAAVATGLLGVGANKGGVALRVPLFRRAVTFVTCHLAAHQGAVGKRNADAEAIAAGLAFAGEAGSAGASAGAGASTREESTEGPGLRESDLVVWTGDMNYRIDLSYESVLDRIAAHQLGPLIAADQLTVQRLSGAVFRGYREGKLAFNPTYKFNKKADSTGAYPYDTSDKKRIPAWCDRVLFRDGQAINRTNFVDPGPVASPPVEDMTRGAATGEAPGAVRAGVVSYDACVDDTVWSVSDHRPVRALLAVSLTAVDAAARRAAVASVAARVAPAQPPLPLEVSPTGVALTSGSRRAGVTLRNRGPVSALFRVRPLRPTDGRDGVPLWLSITPMVGIIPPGGMATLTLELAGVDGGAAALASAVTTPQKARLAVRWRSATVGEGSSPTAQLSSDALLTVAVGGADAVGEMRALAASAALTASPSFMAPASAAYVPPVAIQSMPSFQQAYPTPPPPQAHSQAAPHPQAGPQVQAALPPPPFSLI